jgi:hypothetical protein
MLFGTIPNGIFVFSIFLLWQNSMIASWFSAGKKQQFIS